jgi:hypothetical protein
MPPSESKISRQESAKTLLKTQSDVESWESKRCPQDRPSVARLNPLLSHVVKICRNYKITCRRHLRLGDNGAPLSQLVVPPRKCRKRPTRVVTCSRLMLSIWIAFWKPPESSLAHHLRFPAKNMKKALNFVLLFLLCFVIAGKAHESYSAFERIKHSLPEREAGWQVVSADEPYQLGDGSIQANFLWANGAEEVSATVILCRSSKAVKDQFKRSHKDEPSMDGFMIGGIGDEAYLFPPIVLNQAGPFNLRFRKAHYEIFMRANSKDTVKRSATYIVDSIAQPNKGIQEGTAEPRRRCLTFSPAKAN